MTKIVGGEGLAAIKKIADDFNARVANGYWAAVIARFDDGSERTIGPKVFVDPAKWTNIPICESVSAKELCVGVYIEEADSAPFLCLYADHLVALNGYSVDIAAGKMSWRVNQYEIN